LNTLPLTVQPNDHEQAGAEQEHEGRVPGRQIIFAVKIKQSHKA
jgi:hypothetical protein